MTTTATHYTASVDVAVEDVRRTDELMDRSENLRIANAIKRGPKWIEVRDADAKLIVRAERGTTVTVGRKFETRESIEAKKEARATELLEGCIRDREVEMRKAQAKLNARLDQYGQVDYSEIGNLMTAQADNKVWARFEAVVEGAKSDSHPLHGETLVGIYNRMVQQFREDAFPSYGGNAMSRSTNVLSNLMEDLDRDAIARFVNVLRWTI